MSNKTKTSATKEEATPALMPKLRFPEFRDAEGWERKRLGELFSDRQESGMSGLPLLSLMDKEGIVPQADSNRKNNSNSDKSKYLRVVPGDIAYNTMRMWEGRSALVGLEGLVSPAYTVCEPQPGTHSLLFSYYFKTPQLIEQFQRFSQGLVKDTLNLKYPAFAQISAPVPTYPEQQKIAECLSSVDELIAAQARKLDALKTHKKGLMQQLFPREGETQPRLRFPEFQNAGEWESAPMANFAAINPRREVRPDELEVSFVPMSAVSEDGYLAIQQIRPYGAVKKGFTAFRDLDIILAKITPCFENGKAALVAELSNGVGFGSTEFHVIRTGESCLPAFMFAQLYTDDFRSAGKASMTGSGGQQRVPTRFLEDYTVYVPSIPEQQRIASCLTSLDALIAAETQTLEALKTHKQGLMQQLFPSPEEIEAC
jgi:type I restriction enzyme S subunit